MTKVVKYVSNNPEEWTYEVHCKNTHYLCDLTGKELKEFGVQYPNTLPNAKGGGWSLPIDPTYNMRWRPQDFRTYLTSKVDVLKCKMFCSTCRAHKTYKHDAAVLQTEIAKIQTCIATVEETVSKTTGIRVELRLLEVKKILSKIRDDYCVD